MICKRKCETTRLQVVKKIRDGPIRKHNAAYLSQNSRKSQITAKKKKFMTRGNHPSVLYQLFQLMQNPFSINRDQIYPVQEITELYSLRNTEQSKKKGFDLTPKGTQKKRRQNGKKSKHGLVRRRGCGGPTPKLGVGGDVFRRRFLQLGHPVFFKCLRQLGRKQKLRRRRHSW